MIHVPKVVTGSAFLTILGLLASSFFWLGALDSKVKVIDEVQKKQEESGTVIIQKLGRIEGILEEMRRK